MSSVLWVVGETGGLPGVAQPPAQLPRLVAQPVVSQEAGEECFDHHYCLQSPTSPEDWRPWYLHDHTAVIVSQTCPTVELVEPDLLVVVVLLVLHELPPGYQEIILREFLLVLLLLLVAVGSTTNEFVQIIS